MQSIGLFQNSLQTDTGYFVLTVISALLFSHYKGYLEAGRKLLMYMIAFNLAELSGKVTVVEI